MGDIEISTGQLHRLLKDAERRQLLVVLSGTKRCVPLTTLVERVSEELDASPPQNDLQERCRSLRLQFHHVHLPLFADDGIVEYNPDQHLVKPTAKLEAVAEQLDIEPRRVVAE